MDTSLTLEDQDSILLDPPIWQCPAAHRDDALTNYKGQVYDDWVFGILRRPTVISLQKVECPRAECASVAHKPFSTKSEPSVKEEETTKSNSGPSDTDMSQEEPVVEEATARKVENLSRQAKNKK